MTSDMRNPDANDDDARATIDILDALPGEQTTNWHALIERCDHKLRVLIGCRAKSVAAEIELEDVRQSTWTEAIRCFGRFEYRGPGSFYAWLAQIARNLIASESRRKLPVRAADLAPGAESKAPTGLYDALVASQTSANTRADKRETIERIRDAILALPEIYREVLLRTVYEAKNGRTIAAELGVHESTVSLRLRAAYEKLRVPLRDLAR